MKFYEALKEVMENRKKARQNWWEKSSYIYVNEDRILNHAGVLFLPNSLSLTSDEWEIVKEKVKKTRTVWINCYSEDKQGIVHSTAESAASIRKSSDFLFTKEVTFEWEEEE
jgi:hypothetical protein